jgi:hypothetical protein
MLARVEVYVDRFLWSRLSKRSPSHDRRECWFVNFSRVSTREP